MKDKIANFVQFASHFGYYPDVAEQSKLLLESTSLLKPAAVLILLQQHSEQVDVLLTRRSVFLPTHKGQICFPGGKIESRDHDAIDAALRETEEEVGIIRQDVQVLGCLPLLPTISGFTIEPVVGWLPNQTSLNLNHQEVDEAFYLPLHQALNLGNYQEREIVKAQHVLNTWALPYQSYDIWGATAVILHYLALAFNHYPDRQALHHEFTR